jgi:hypothetical protein
MKKLIKNKFKKLSIKPNLTCVGIAILLFSLGCNIGQIINTKAETKVATINVDFFIKKMVQSMAERGLSEDETKAKTKEELSKLDVILQKIAQKDGIIVIPSKAVIAGGIDITEQVEAILEKQNEK